jgi:hypothetical protein
MREMVDSPGTPHIRGHDLVRKLLVVEGNMTIRMYSMTKSETGLDRMPDVLEARRVVLVAASASAIELFAGGRT